MNDVPDAVKEMVAKALGIKSFSYGWQELTDGTVIEVDTIWIAEFPYVFTRNIYLIGIHLQTLTATIEEDVEFCDSTIDYREMILAASYKSCNFVAPNSCRLIQVKYPVMAGHLRTVNLLPPFAYKLALDGSSLRFSVHIYSEGTQAHVRYECTLPADEQVTELYKAIFAEIKYIAERYNDSEINAVIAHGRVSV